MMNAKNQLLELLQKRGLPLNLADFDSQQPYPGAPWQSTVTVSLPDRPTVSGTGTGSRKSDAEVNAAADALLKLNGDDSAWDPIRAEAQVGDALLKLAAYLADDLDSPEAKSAWLQVNESDAKLARIFDRWQLAGDPDVSNYGAGLGEKYKSTLVEAILWRRYGRRVLGPEAAEALRELRRALTAG